MNVKTWAKNLVTAKPFEVFISIVIVVNCLFIGIETYFHNPKIYITQQIALSIFIFEIILRFIAADGIKSFFKNGWNVFDLSLIIISLVPESLFAHPAAITSLRILRVFRVLRLVRAAPEIKLIINVLIRSFSALTYNALFFCIFLYLFAIIGVTLFKLPAVNAQTPPEIILAMKEMKTIAPNSPENAPEPYGTLHESMFTLFRIMTGDDWTDMRYNLLKAYELKLIHVPPFIITVFHIMWFCLSAFLLLNLVVGAIVNNYQVIMEEMRKKKESKLPENQNTTNT
ncbi:MAG: ion transporter [Endomicrobium sp.]|jgi:voltage-gated sodium channel|nr:ion transporter [Endomicrobium sp.]